MPCNPTLALGTTASSCPLAQTLTLPLFTAPALSPPARGCVIYLVAAFRGAPDPPRHGFPRLIVAMIGPDDGVGDLVENGIHDLLSGCFQAVCYGKRNQLFLVPAYASAHRRKIERKLPPFFETVHGFVFSEEPQTERLNLFERHGGHCRRCCTCQGAVRDVP